MAAPASGNFDTAKILITCADFAARKHTRQRRKDPDQTPYINHPIGVAKILVDAGISDTEVLQGALLHDTVEDTETTLEELEQAFGKRVRDIVDEVSDDKTLDKAARKQLQIDKAATKSHQAKLVAMADKIYNLRDLIRCTPEGWTEERVGEYFVWARAVIEGYRGSNDTMEKELDRLFEQKMVR